MKAKKQENKEEEEKPTCYELLTVKYDLSKYDDNIKKQLMLSHAPLDACELFLNLLMKWCPEGG
ncbi:MAG: hypothetical protein OWQ51_03965 [Pyrobaculum arsenaticum]|uniref:hypothetical protein n=1 Tax=Pyrobaculum arsenaticum TaxID=121277 RepID=UPI0022755D09|nr:hypothetical protein [Pyrobaculum arsenaticum]